MSAVTVTNVFLYESEVSFLNFSPRKLLGENLVNLLIVGF